MFAIKKVFATLTALALSTVGFMPTLHAENSKAQQLREIINSNKYYVEYEVNTKEDRRALAVDGNKRKSFDCEGRRNDTLLRFIPIVGLFAKGSLKLMPEVFYYEGSYYQFLDNKRILKATTEELDDPYLDPSEEWKTVPRRIKLPDEFCMFTDDKDVKFVETASAFDGDKKKDITFDKYVKIIKNVNASPIAKKVYLVCYNDKGEPDRILTLTVDFDQDAGTIFVDELAKKPEDWSYDIQRITIRKFIGELPKDVMEFSLGSKVFAPGLGNMDELLDAQPLLEEH